MDADQVYAFVFRGLLAQEALDKTEARARMPMSPHLDEDVARRLSLQILDGDLLARDEGPSSIRQ